MEMKFDAAYKRIMKDILGTPKIDTAKPEKVDSMKNVDIPKPKDDPALSKIDGTKLDVENAPKASEDAKGKGDMGKPKDMGVPSKGK